MSTLSGSSVPQKHLGLAGPFLVTVPHVGAGQKGPLSYVWFYEGLVTLPSWSYHPALVLETLFSLLLVHNPLLATETHRFYASLAQMYLAAKPGLDWWEAFRSHYLSHSVWLFICFNTAILMCLITTWGYFVRHGFYKPFFSNIWKLLNSETYLHWRVSDRP